MRLEEQELLYEKESFHTARMHDDGVCNDYQFGDQEFNDEVASIDSRTSGMWYDGMMDDGRWTTISVSRQYEIFFDRKVFTYLLVT